MAICVPKKFSFWNGSYEGLHLEYISTGCRQIPLRRIPNSNKSTYRLYVKHRTVAARFRTGAYIPIAYLADGNGTTLPPIPYGNCAVVIS